MFIIGLLFAILPQDWTPNSKNEFLLFKAWLNYFLRLDSTRADLDDKSQDEPHICRYLLRSGGSAVEAGGKTILYKLL